MDNTSLTFMLTDQDWFQIQQRRGLCSEVFNCWISVGEGFLQDTSQNSIIPVPLANSLPVREFDDDVGRPSLIGFELDLNANSATLSFSETVSSITLDPTAITILNSPSENATMISLTGGRTSSGDGRVIVVDLLKSDTDRIRARDDIGTSENNTFIAINESLITDTVISASPNFVNPIRPSSALPVMGGGLTPDTTPPRLVSFDLDLDLDLISLTFDEPIRASSVLYTGITLLSDTSEMPTDNRTLIGGNTTSQTDFNGSFVLTAQLLQPDIRYLKLSEFLATSSFDTRLSILKGSVLDMSGNQLVEITPEEAVQVSTFTPDDTPVSLIDFTLDMDMGQIHLTFNDIIDANTFYAPALTLQNSRNLSPENSVTFTTSTLTTSPNGYFITVDISTSDLNRIKVNDNLGTRLENSFVTMRAEAFDDNFGRNVLAVTKHEGIPASQFTEDRTAPILLDFDFNANNETITLIFDETVRANTIVEEELLLLNADNISEASSFFQLTAASASSADSTVIVVYLTTPDLNIIKSLSDLATFENNTFLAFSDSLIMDMNRNEVEEVANDSAIRARRYFIDRTPPILYNFTIDLDTEVIVLTFDETVNGSSLNIPEFTVQGSSGIVSGSRRLSDSSHSSNFSTFVTIFLGLNDLNEIKRLTDVATSTSDTYLSITGNSIQDMSRNFAVPILRSAALMASGYARDETRPVLISFSLNLTSEILTLSYSETVRVSTQFADQYTFLSLPDGDTEEDIQRFSLTGGISQPNDYHIVEIELRTPDLNEIKLLTNLATDENNTYLAVQDGAVADMSGNLLVGILEMDAIPVSIFYEDQVPPTLLSFNLDLNDEVLSLMFSESVQSATFDVTQITIQDNRFELNENSSRTLSRYSILESNNSNVFIISLASVDVNSLKVQYNLAIDNTSTFLSFTSDLVMDMNGNSIVAIPTSQALPVSVFVPDQNRPSLEEFDLNLNSSELLLRFNETVNRDSLNVDSITIQHAGESTGALYSLDLTQSSSSSSPNNTFIIIDIGLFDLNNLKRLTAVATSRNDSFLSLNYTAIEDMNANAILQISGSNALQVSNFVPDGIRPVLQGFSFDANTGTLILSFSETVDAETLNISAITFQSSETVVPGVMVTLMEGEGPELSYSNSTDNPILTVYLGNEDLNAIKEFYQLANDPSSTFISVTSYLVRDMVGLPVEDILEEMALAVTNYTADITGPRLLSFAFNLTSELLVLTFDETVNVGSFDITQAIIQSGFNTTYSSFYPLTSLRSVSAENSTIISISLALEDLHRIKLNTDLAVSPETTYLRLLPSAVIDMALTPNYIQPTVLPVDIDDYEEDRVSPNLVSFYADLDLGHLTLNFDEPVNASSTNFASITLLSDRISSTDFDSSNATMFTLSGGYTNSSNGLQVLIILTDDDLNAVKRDEILFTDISTSYLSITSDVITDMNNNRVNAIPPSDALPATAFFNDTTSPSLLGFDLNMNTGVLIFSFLETVDVSTTMFERIVLQQNSNVSAEMNRYMLTGGSLRMQEDGLVVVIQITDEDRNELKRRRIGVSRETTWLTVEDLTILDMNDQRIVPLVNGISARQVTNYTTDRTPPVLERFDLNLTSEILSLTFSETVDIFQFNVSSITLQDTLDGMNTLNHFQLTDSSYLNSPDGTEIDVVLGLEDLNSIKELYELATEPNNTYLQIDSSLVEDVFGNNVVEISSSRALPVSEFTDDSISPALRFFDLDLDSRVLTLYFSETVDMSTLDISAFVFTGVGQPSEAYQLRSSFSTSGNSSIQEISLTREDFNAIAFFTTIATSAMDTRLMVDSTAIRDMAGNDLTAVTTPTTVRNYTKDVSSPQLENFDLDMNELILTLEFSETVNVSSIDISAVSIVGSSGQYPSYMLTDGTVLGIDSPIVRINISKVDEDNIKRIENLATSDSNTFILITSDLIEDMSENLVENITVPLAVGNFTRDMTLPVLQSFSLNLTADILTLTFSETVNITSLDISGISLQSDEILNENVSFYNLYNSEPVSLVADPVVTIVLSRVDADEIRRRPGLASDRSLTYLVLETNTIFDMVRLTNVPIATDMALLASEFYADLVNPYLESFSLDLTEERLYLNFSETINIATFDISQITLHGSRNVSLPSVTLTGGTVLNMDFSSYLTLSLTTPDLNLIKLQTNIATDLSNTYISLTSALVQDMNSNEVVEITRPVIASSFVSDSISPVLTAFDVNLDSETLMLTFSETVNVASLEVTQISFQASRNESSPLFSLTNSSISLSMNGTVVVVNISVADLNRIKQLDSILTNSTNTFVTLTSAAIEDMNMNSVVVVLPSNAVEVSNFTPDRTSPELVSVDLDLDAELISLTFSETVDVSTINVTGISIQSDRVFLDGMSVSVGLTGLANISVMNSPVVTIQVTQFDLNRLKNEVDLATDIENTFINVNSETVRDTFGNTLVLISSDDALQVANVFDDFTSPELLDFTFDLNTGIITLFFSESVNSSSLDPVRLTLYSSLEASLENFTLTGISDMTLSASNSGTIVEFQLLVADINDIKSMINLATMTNDTFLTITPQFILDQAGNPILEPRIRLRPMSFVADSGCPRLVDFDLDLNVGLLILTFDEPLNTSTFDPTTLQISNLIGDLYNLTSASFDGSSYLRILDVVLSDFDRNLLAANEDLATTPSNTYVSLSENSAVDSAGNAYCNDTVPVQVRNVTSDQQRPILLNFTLDLLNEVIVFTFSESVRIPVSPQAVTLLAEPDLTFTGSGLEVSGSGSGSGVGSVNISREIGVTHYTLTGGNSTINYTITPHIVTLDLTQDDLNEIKNRLDLGSSLENTYVSITNVFAIDHNSNPVVEIPPNEAQRAEVFVLDRTPPRVVSFDFNLEERCLLLTFSEVINITSLTTSAITIQGGQSISPGNFYTLRNSSASLDSLTVVSVALSDEDSNAIKAIRTLGTSQNNTYISFTSDLVRDYFDLPVVAVLDGNALRTMTFTRDSSPPMLLRFTLNLTSEELILTFDETVNAASVIVPSIFIQSDEVGSEFVPLTTSNGSMTDSTVITITLGLEDLYNLKINLDLATESNNTCVMLRERSLADLSVPENPIRTTVLCDADFIGDTVRPRLTAFAVNVNESTLTLNFDEPIDIFSINVTFLSLQAAASAGTGVQEVTLRGGNAETSDQLEVILTLTLDDLNLIKQNLNLLVSQQTSYLRIGADFIADANGNPVVDIRSNDALQASMYVRDTTEPVLEAFDLDMNSGLLTLYFSETVSLLTFTLPFITLQRQSSRMSNNYYSLTAGEVIYMGVDSPVAVINLTNNDLNALKTRDIGRTNTSAWITIENATVFDVSGEPVRPIVSGVNALRVSGYTPDVSSPMLTGFSVDLTSEILVLSFNESVDPLSLDMSQITLTSGVNITAPSLTFSLNTSFTRQTDMLPEVTIILTTSDLDEIKRLSGLAATRNSTYIFLTSAAITDTFENPVVSIEPQNAVLVDTFMDDFTAPVLLSFDFDANRGRLSLTFSETVNSSSLDITGITFYSDLNSPAQMYSLQYRPQSVSLPLNTIDIVISNDDFNEIKIRDMLAIDNTTLWLSIRAGTVYDMNSIAVLESPVLNVTTFIPDTTPPMLLSFSIDMNQGELTLNFDETVNSSSLVFNYLALINNETFMPIPIDPNDQHQLTGGTLLTDVRPSLTFRFDIMDLNEIKRKDMCTRARGVADCFLVLRSDAIFDMSRNGIFGCRQVNT